MARSDPLLPGAHPARSSWIVVALVAAFLVVLTAATLAVYRRARTHLDDELGARLRAIALGVAHAVEIARPGATDADSLVDVTLAARVLPVLVATRDENDLANVLLATPDGRTLVDLARHAARGEPDPLLDLDFAAVALARNGVAAATTLYRAGDVFMKSAYAPVFDERGDVVALVGVEAGAGFFDELRDLRHAIGLVSATSMIVVLVLGAVVIRRTRSLERALAAAWRNEQLAGMGRMAANIAHEIRNPLSIIRTAATRMRRTGRVEPELIDDIVTEVDDLNQILTGYLEFARGEESARRETVAARRVVERSIAAAAHEAARRDVRIEPDVEDGVALHVDERRVRQALINVLLNAVQASPPGGIVHVEARRAGRRVRLDVADAGPGIARERLGDVTRPFYTTRADGSGLGLSVVEAVVRAHDGRLIIDSEPGRGTRVTLVLPAAPAGPDTEFRERS